MNSRITMGLAGVFLVGALIAGYWGVALSRRPAAEPVAQPSPAIVQTVTASAEDATRQPVAVLVRDIPPFVPIKAADVALERLRTAPAGSLKSLDQVIGRTPWRALSAGTWLSEESFEAGGSVARMIRPDERALAVAVDEVIGASGQLSPGDYVDVLLFLRQDSNNLLPSAQVVVPALRVLGIGEQLGLTNDGKPGSPPASPEEKLKQDQRRLNARSVLLAVPEPLLSRLMLAAQAGVLRLAVRSADEKRLAHYWAGKKSASKQLQNLDRSLIQFNQLALSTPPPSSARTFDAAARRAQIEVIRGIEASQQTP
ncbi:MULTISPECIES: Flp pilus assembly protein CpaB [Pseudomonas]|uniref:Flp pilus assembly protein CpaB n=1 Tax=Pseudomonas TaxID=286 RepID=UPI0007B3B1A4|nr:MULTISPECIES: Flp pilus assembly protein CpaB [Pseudomonas]AZC48320.1 Flp pilus assembly protein RcpC/CpaB [Pseudomonas chlororaphis subsp. piscium]AZC54897.1 Flp pilus assembly protein RcpC/CpaB [Pseudomonas chlororaphis subsp. piscium]AZC61219.1 Flp pilus assembly protein RcpC/CpaB [Pseudomonas chlororaphis subsp. piscium]AZC67442.1 Flp pilus assembly protein RcpC/CpaB [Pseudomonas chlororaphis subsp. piscium]AZC79856.1 Flp pilus assembly protein RcpC/CpaB [Pseudomonas chlororaphis subsp.